MILEWVLADLTGDELCRRLRLLGDVPILVAWVLDDAQTRIGALESGAATT